MVKTSTLHIAIYLWIANGEKNIGLKFDPSIHGNAILPLHFDTVLQYHTLLYAGTWLTKQVCENIDGESAGDNSGNQVSLTADGKTEAIGSLFNDDNGENSGRVRVFSIEET